MKRRTAWSGSLLLVVGLMIACVWQVNAFGGTASVGLDKADFAKKRITQLQETAKLFRELARPPLPANLSPDQKKDAERFYDWLNAQSTKLDELGTQWQAALQKTETSQDAMQKMQQMQEMNQSFNLQYLALQERMQDESRRFSLLSNIMKTKHDTAKNSISNLR